MARHRADPRRATPSVCHLIAERQAAFGRCFDTCDAALAAAAAGPAHHHLYRRMRPWPQTRRTARELADHACTIWDLQDLSAAARIVTTELTDNAIRHAHTTLGLAISHSAHWLHLSVRDHSHEPPTIYGPHHPASRWPQGLLRVEAVTPDWSTTTLPYGKIVWPDYESQHPGKVAPKRHRRGMGRCAT